jgi:hypothetical protein
VATSAVGVRFPEHLVKHEEAWEGCGHVQVVHMLLQHLITDDAVMTEVRAYARIVVVCRYTASPTRACVSPAPSRRVLRGPIPSGCGVSVHSITYACVCIPRTVPAGASWIHPLPEHARFLSHCDDVLA